MSVEEVYAELELLVLGSTGTINYATGDVDITYRDYRRNADLGDVGLESWFMDYQDRLLS